MEVFSPKYKSLCGPTHFDIYIYIYIYIYKQEKSNLLLEGITVLNVKATTKSWECNITLYINH